MRKEVLESLFLKEASKSLAETISNEGAKKYSTSGSEFVDQFASISYYKDPRTYDEVAKDMQLLWSIDSEKCLKLAVYIRLITRKSIVYNPAKKIFELQRGQGLKNEGILRIMWIAINHPDTFKANINYFIAAGSWKDLFKMLSIDYQLNGWLNRKLDWVFFRNVIAVGLNNSDTSNLVRKYLPTIRTNKECKTEESKANTFVGRYLASTIFVTGNKKVSYKLYRITKSEGIAHKWQQLISKQLYEEIDFNTIAGRALNLIINSRFLQNQNLVDKYVHWLQSRPTVKYTGFVFELFNALGDEYPEHIEDYREDTINKQFMQLVQSSNNSNLLVCRDTSGSMFSNSRGCNMSSYSVAKAMALYFSYSLKGPFANSYIEFSDDIVLKHWNGKTPCEKWVNDTSSAIGATNFHPVIDLFVKLKKEGLKEEEFPTGLLLVSDGEFTDHGINDETKFQNAIKKLRKAEFSEEYVNNFKIILWDIPNYFYGHDNSVKFEDFVDAPNFFYISGYDPSAIDFIFGNKEFKASPRNAEELFEVAMDQPLLNELKIIEEYDYPF